MEPDNPLLDRYVLSLAQANQPKICFIPTASGDSDRYIVRFYSTFLKLPCIPSHLSLFSLSTDDLRAFILAQDIIYVGGGNTKNMIAVWQAWNLDHILREAWEQGVILSGLSAGSLCWFEAGLSDYYPGSLNPLRGLGFLSGSHCPHYDGEPDRRPAYHHFIIEGKLTNGYAADDGVALHFIGDRLTKIVSSRPQARAYRLEKVGNIVKETILKPIFLGKPHLPTLI